MTLITRTRKLLFVCLLATALPNVASSDSLSELDPSLLAVTITDFEVGESSDFHSAYWAYEAEVEATIAGPEYEGEIRFIIAKATDLGRVFPAQYVLVFRRDHADLDEQMGTLVEAISMQDAKKTACFSYDLAELFPDSSRFARNVADSESSPAYCYESSDLLAEAKQ